MRASHIEFRLRVGILFAIIAVGFWSPWIETLGIGKRITLLEWLALELSRLGLLPFTAATPVLIVLSAVIAAGAAALRIGGTAYLGSETVNSMQMRAGVLTVGGPYRFVRNPLYLGSELMFIAMAFVMPPTGAVFAIVLTSLFHLRLILGEEKFLSDKLGDAYRIYLRSVPRLFPRLRTSWPAEPVARYWGRAVLAEINSVGVFLTMAVLSWRYDHWLMIRAVLVSFGVSLVIQAALPPKSRV